MTWQSASTALFPFAYPVVPAPFVVKMILSPNELSWHPRQRSIECKCDALSLDSQLYSTDLLPILKSVLHFLDYRSFGVSFKIGNCNFSNLVTFKDYLGYVGVPYISI